jgi:predicted AAA+ superfamily ATPase
MPKKKTTKPRPLSSLIKRPLYYQRIKPFMNKPVIKVITGMRRVGKSYFLRQIISELVDSGIPESNIIYIDKDSLSTDTIQTYQDLDELVQCKLKSIKNKQTRYLFIDEIQKISDWEKAINSYLNEEVFDIYITGSNAHLLSSELATYISGRYITIPIYSLSFQEFIEFRSQHSSEINVETEFDNYIRYGGLPGIHKLELDEETIFMYLSSIFNTILLKDIINRYEIRNSKLLEDLSKFICSNIGNSTSAKSVADYLKSQRIKVGFNTIQNDIKHLEDAYFINKASRYDIKGKKFFEFKEKYFLSDLGMRHALIGYRQSDINAFMENLVYLELKRSGYEVCIGSLDNLEVDFIATKAKEKHYIQVCYMLSDAKVVDREFGVLTQISDSYPKHVISTDRLWGEDYNGIKRTNFMDFCLKGL